ncbi:MAG TPA: hypothetical protein VF131_23105 [Blastocatellia bacterium]|nr:hypothetical protein [Blastocatellia bacterium]
MLLGSNLLEVAIGMIFVYLLLSLLCSALSELIESLIKFRARDLEKGVGKLLNNPELTKNFFNHPLIKPLGEKPSYIPARTFTLTLWNLATTEAAKGKEISAGVTQDLKAIRDLIASLDGEKNGNIKASLLTLIDEAGNDINRARANIEGWYNDAMDRVSGWYKRRVHWILMVIGLLAAGILNIDTITVTRTLWYDDTLRKSVVTAADTYVKGNQPPPTQAAPPPQGGPVVPKDAANPAEQAKDALKRVNDVQAEINRLALPIGWIHEPKANDPKYADDKENAEYNKDLEAYLTDPRRFPENNFASWFLKVLGILFTALAVSQGAPFWFDLLNKFIVIRSTVKPREKSQEQPSKDKPAPETTKEQIEDKDKDK